MTWLCAILGLALVWMLVVIDSYRRALDYKDASIAHLRAIVRMSISKEAKRLSPEALRALVERLPPYTGDSPDDDGGEA